MEVTCVTSGQKFKEGISDGLILFPCAIVTDNVPDERDVISLLFKPQ